jgi:hypothetical protein
VLCALELVVASLHSLGLQVLNFSFKRFIFKHLALQKPVSQSGFLGEAAWSKDVDIAEFIFRLSEFWNWCEPS